MRVDTRFQFPFAHFIPHGLSLSFGRASRVAISGKDALHTSVEAGTFTAIEHGFESFCEIVSVIKALAQIAKSHAYFVEAIPS